jgi:hypothetical protein
MDIIYSPVLISKSYNVDRDHLYRLGRAEYVPHKEGERSQSPKRSVL